MAKTKVTLNDVAAYLDVAPSTVSRALAGHSSISSDTKLRVTEAVRSLGYIVDSGARALKSGQSDVVGLMVPDLRNEFYAAIAQSLADNCSEQQRQLVLSLSGDDPVRELALVKALLSAKPQGLVAALTSRPLEETLEHLSHVRCVQFFRRHPAVHGAVVTVEEGEGARRAADHLVQLGHRRIAFVGVSASLSTGAARLMHYESGLAAASVASDPDLTRTGPATDDFGYEAVRAVMALSRPPTAIYLSSPQQTAGGLKAIGELKLQVPEQVSVVVTGSAIWYEIWPGGLTSIGLPLRQMADIASRLLLAPGPDTQESAFVKLGYELHLRGSTAAP